MAMQQGIAAFI